MNDLVKNLVEGQEKEDPAGLHVFIPHATLQQHNYVLNNIMFLEVNVGKYWFMKYEECIKFFQVILQNADYLSGIWQYWLAHYTVITGISKFTCHQYACFHIYTVFIPRKTQCPCRYLVRFFEKHKKNKNF